MGGVFQREKSKESPAAIRTLRKAEVPIFDFSSYVFSNGQKMSVIGIDLGNQSCYVATARAGGIELILNDYSNRDTPAFVSFHDQSRSLGTAAKNNLVVNLQNTVFNFKRLLGRKFRDPFVQEELKYLPYRVFETSEGEIGIKVVYMGNEVTFNPEQVTGMLLGKLKAVSEADLKTPVNDCVISVPAYFTEVERRALLAAAQIGGLRVLRLMNEPTAVALSYGLYSQDLPEVDQPPKNIVFIDIGYATTELAAVAFNKGRLKVLGTSFDANLGGRNLDYALVSYFAEEFKNKYKIDVFGNKRALIRLRDECEKLKKMMSSISNEIPLNIECFMNDKDVSGFTKRDHFEQLISEELTRFESKMRELLDTTKLAQGNIDKVEIVGGGTRIPAIKALIKKIFGVDPSTSLNQDEAVARGCAIQCAILSPTLKVKEFAVSDVCPYAIEIQWPEKMSTGRLEVFSKNNPAPATKVITISRGEPFAVDAYYTTNQNIPHGDRWIGKFKFLDVKPAPGETTTKVRIKTRINANGLFGVAAALREEIVLVEDDAASVQIQPMETDESNQKLDGSTEEKDESKMEVDENKVDTKEPKKTKKQAKQIELRVESEFPEYTPLKVQELVEIEMEMRSQDKAAKEKADARNSLEEYIYEFRDKISGDYSDFISDHDRERFSELLRNTEDWLYNEGEDQLKSAYSGKLTELQGMGNPVVHRYREGQERANTFQEMSHSMQLSLKAIDAYRSGHEDYAHLDPKDVEKALKSIEEKQKWLDERLNAQSKLKLHVDPHVTVAQIKNAKQEMESVVHPILKKPKPAAPKPQKPPATKGEKGSEEPAEHNGTGAGDPDQVPMETS